MLHLPKTWAARVGAAIFCTALAGLMSGSVALAQSKPVVVFAAASLKNALDEIGEAWQRDTGKAVTVSFAASNTLAKQIEAGAPADVFFSADLDWMDDLDKKKLIQTQSRSNLLGNRIALIAPKDSTVDLAVKPGFELANALAGGRLAMGNVDAVPAGKYGKAALERLGVWADVKDKVAQAESVRAALLLVSRGEAPLGIVYQTDAAADPNVKIVAAFPEDTHPPIIYPVALTAAETNPDAAAFLAFLRSGKARPLFEKQGFTIMDKSASGS